MKNNLIILLILLLGYHYLFNADNNENKQADKKHNVTEAELKNFKHWYDTLKSLLERNSRWLHEYERILNLGEQLKIFYLDEIKKWIESASFCIEEIQKCINNNTIFKVMIDVKGKNDIIKDQSKHLAELYEKQKNNSKSWCVVM